MDKKLGKKEYKVDFAGKELILETGKLAGLAHGSITASCGETVVLATVVIGKEPREGVDFFPLMVDYEERFYAAGKISGSRFIKREGRPSDAAILAARKIDRPIRPLFPKEFKCDVQIVVTVLSYDGENDPDVLALIAASSALMQTNAPYKGPIGLVNIAIVDDKITINPSVDQLDKSVLKLNLATTSDRVMMLEVESDQVSEESIIEAIKEGIVAIKPLIEVQQKIAKDSEIIRIEGEDQIDSSIAIKAEIHNLVGDKIKKALFEYDQKQREGMLNEFEAEVLDTLEGSYKQIDLKNTFAKFVHKEVRNMILNQAKRPDGRGADEIRPLGVEVGLLPRTHGSGLFSRGDTQALTIATLASPGMEQFIDTMEEETTKRFMHHYNFPPFSTGEVSPMRGASRREIGHGYLAEKALRPVIPKSDDFPYTIRLVSEILSSNGSSSMAATCGATLALMDAGVPIKKPVSGIAMGLVANDDVSKYQILTDLQGLEDFAGDMDFKVAGTRDGVTAVQMDTKISGLTMEIIEKTFSKAKQGRMNILDQMEAVISKPRQELSSYAPRIEAIKINPEKIADIIGPGGKTIRKTIEDCGGKEVTGIDVEEDGTVMISSTDPKMGEKAISTILALTREIVPGEVITGEIKEIKRDRMSGKEIGAIVQITPKQDGMIHISQICRKRIDKVSDIVKRGDVVTAKVIEVNPEKGRVALSMKAVEGND